MKKTLSLIPCCVHPLLLATLALLLPPPAGAAAYDTWYGSVDGRWSTDDNWSTFQGAYPGSIFYCGLIFDSHGTSRLTNTNDLPGRLFDGLLIYTSGYDLRGNDFGIATEVLASYPSGYTLVEPGLNFGTAGGKIWVYQGGTLWLGGSVTVNNIALTVTNIGELYSSGPWQSSGTASVNFQGPGPVELTAANSPFAGTVNLSGQIEVFGAMSNALFNVSGTVSGGGTLGRVALTGGRLQPGYSFGTGQLTVASNLTADAASTMSFRISGPTPGIEYDQLRLSNTNSTTSLGNCQLQFVPTIPPTLGQSFTLIDKAGTNKVTGTFAGWPEGGRQFINNAFYQITYAGGDGNDVVITTTNLTAIWKGGAATPAWSQAANWQNNLIPGTNYDVLFPAFTGVTSMSSSNDLPGRAINRVTFTGSNYVFTGASIPIRAGIVSSNISGSSYFYGGITLLGDQTWVDPVNQGLTVSNVISGTNALTLFGGFVNISGIGPGTNTITITGPSNSTIMAFYGTNTHSGPLAVQGGNFYINGDCTKLSVITVSNATLQGGREVSSVALLAPNANFTPSTFAAITAYGTMSFTNGVVHVAIYGPSSYSNNFNRMNVNGPVLITTNSQLALNIQYTAALGDTYRILNNTGPYAINGYFNGLPEGTSLAGSNQLLRISYRGGDGDDLTLTAIPYPHIWNAATGSGLWTTAGNWLSNSPPSAGDGMIFPAFISGLAATNDFPPYTAFESLITSNNYTFYGNPVQLTGGFRIDGSSIFNPPIRVAGNQVWNVGTNFLLTGPVDLTTNVISFASSGDVIFSNNVTGTSGSVVSLGALNSLTFNGSNNFSGLLRMLGGTLTNNGPQLNSPIRLDQANWFVRSGSLVSNAPVSFAGSPGNWTMFNGQLVNGSFTMSGGTFTIGAGAAFLNCPTTLSNGTLSVFGQMPGSSITMAGGTLSGTGIVANVTATGGTIAPGGASPGRLQTANLILAPAVTVEMQIAGPIPGISHDQIQVSGAVSLVGASLHLSLVDETLNLGDTVVLIKKDGTDPVNGTFAGLPENTTFPLGLLDVRISYVGGAGNDIVLTVINKIPRATWTGLGSTNDWATVTNWVRNTPPIDGDNLYFPAVATNLVNINSLGNTSYASIYLGGSNYMIYADDVTLTGGIIATNPAGTNWIDSVLPTASSIISNVPGNTLALTGVLQDAPLNVYAAGNVNVLGDLAGGSNVVMAGTGTLRIYNTNRQYRGNFLLQRGLTVAYTTNSFGYQAANSVSVSSSATLLMTAAGDYSSRFFLGGTQHVAASGSVIENGDHTLTASNSSYTVDGGASLIINGLVSGPFGLRKDGAGEMYLTLTNAYTGATFVNGGTLYLAGLPTNAPAGSVNINNGSMLRGGGPCGPIFLNQGVLAPGYSDAHTAFSAHDGVSMGAQGTYRLRLSNVPDGTYDSMAVGGPVVLVSPQLQLVMDFRPPVGASYTLISNDGTDPVVGTFASLPQNAFYTNGPTVFRILYTGGTGNDVVAVADHYLSTGITRTWTGAGTNALWSNPQNWSTNIAPQSGDALYFPPGALRSTNQNDFITNTFFHAITIGGTNYRLTGNIVAVLGGITATNLAGSNTVALPVAILTNMTFRCEAPAATLSFEAPVDNNSRRLLLGGAGTILGLGPLVGYGDVEQTGPGLVELRGTNSYSGETKVSGGRLRFQNSPLGMNGGGVVVTNNAILELSATTNVTEDFTISGTILLTNAAVINVQGNFDFPTNSTGTLNVAPGTLAVVAPSFTHDGGGPIKEGLGDLYLSIADLKKEVYTGPAVINQGRLIFDSQTKGVAADFGTFIVNAGGTLAATGQVNRIVVNNGGTLAPGLFSGVGPLTVGGSLTLAPGATLAVDLQGVSPSLDFDTIFVNGTVNLNNATLAVTLGYDAVLDSQYQIINNDGTDPVVGTFAALPEGATFATASGSYQVTYAGGDGNDVLLTVVASPPSIQSFVSLSNGSKQITGRAQPGWFAIIEATSSLKPPITWDVLDVQIPDGSGLVTFTDNDATNHPVRFYRITAP